MNRAMLKNIKDPWGMFLLSLSLAGYFLFWNIIWSLKGGVSEREEYLIFIRAWITIPVLTIVVTVFIENLRQEYFKNTAYFYPVLVFGQVIFWFAGILILRMSEIGTQEHGDVLRWIQLLDQQIPNWKTGDWQGVAVPEQVYYGIAASFLILNLILLGALYFFKPVIKSDYTSKKFSDMIYQIVPLGVALVMLNFSGAKASRFSYLMIAIGLSSVAFWHEKIRKALL